MPPGRPPRKTRTVKSIRENPTPQEFTDLFRLGAKNLATSARGDLYLRLGFEDRTGTIEGFVWEAADRLDRELRVGDIVEVAGRGKMHRGTPQLQIQWIRPLGDQELRALDPSEFRAGLPREERDRLWEALVALGDEVVSPPLRALLATFFDDPEFKDRFCLGRAAKTFHHAYDGGLLEHTVGLMRLARSVGGFYPERVDVDLLTVGAFLHDVAKVVEFDDRTGEYTDEGRLVGHIALGVSMIEERAARVPDFPRGLRLQLTHLVLAHHGQAEWGSPVRPRTIEAIALHFIDNLDAKINGAWTWLEKENVAPGEWSGYWRGGETALMRTPRGDGGKDDREMRAVEEAMLAGEPAPPTDPVVRATKQGALF